MSKKKKTVLKLKKRQAKTEESMRSTIDRCIVLLPDLNGGAHRHSQNCPDKKSSSPEKKWHRRRERETKTSLTTSRRGKRTGEEMRAGVDPVRRD